jgi:hypothetical protein
LILYRSWKATKVDKRILKDAANPETADTRDVIYPKLSKVTTWSRLKLALIGVLKFLWFFQNTK